MIKITNLSELSEDQYRALIERQSPHDAVLNSRVRNILDDVHQHGDDAIRKLTQEIDGVDLKSFKLDKSEISGSFTQLDLGLQRAIENARVQIEAYHAKQRQGGYEIENLPGVKLQRIVRPFRRVGIYTPRNLISSLLMAAVPARIAGVTEIAVCSPPDQRGEVPLGIRGVCELLKINEIYAIGGAQAIGALAYGTESINSVDLIVGPGNAYVTKAKELVRDEVAIDMLAGPSEILLVAEFEDRSIENFEVDWAAADLKAQLEHGPGTTAFLVTDNSELAESVSQRLAAEDLKDRNMEIVLFENADEMIKFINDFAPEHLSIWSARDQEILDRVENAGSIFLGPWAPVALGDYASGTNHILPTSGNARFTGGLGVDTFIKKISVQNVSERGLQSLAQSVMRLATEEGLPEHANSVRVRWERDAIA